MPNITIKTNAAKVNRWLSSNIKKFDPAQKKALSQAVLQVQAAERKEIGVRFTVRKTSFIRNRVKIFQFPKKNGGVWTARIGIDSNVQGSPLLLAMFEDSSTKKPQQGQSVAVPITGAKARPTFSRNVAPSLQLSKLNLHAKDGEFIGNKRTVILTAKDGKKILFQRTGKGKNSKLVPVYVFERNVRLRKRLNFVKIAEDLASEQIPKLLNRYLRLYVKE